VIFGTSLACISAVFSEESLACGDNCASEAKCQFLEPYFGCIFVHTIGLIFGRIFGRISAVFSAVFWPYFWPYFGCIFGHTFGRSFSPF
jgi:hypothetical protein